MKLIPNWRIVLVKAWSPRLAVLTMTLASLLPVLPLVNEIIYVPNWLMITAIAVCALATGASRLIHQKGITDG